MIELKPFTEDDFETFKSWVHSAEAEVNAHTRLWMNSFYGQALGLKITLVSHTC